MPKIVKWGTDASTIDDVEVKDQEDFEPYAGDMPPRGMILTCDVKRITAETFKPNSDNPSYGVKMLLEVNETDPKKEKYNGLAYWENVIDGESTAFKIRQLMDAIGSKSPGADWNKTAIDERDGVKIVVKFGNIKVDGAGLQVRVIHKNGRNQDGDPRAEVMKLLPAVARTTAAKARAKSAIANEPDDDGEEAPF